jgi:hypothetical protein
MRCIHQGVDCSRVQNFVVTHIPEDVKEMLISLLSKIRVLLQEFAANYRGFFFIINWVVMAKRL